MKTRVMNEIRRIISRLKRQLWPHSLILMYHRIGEATDDPWSMAVTPSNFAEQLDMLRRHFQVVSMRQMTHDLMSGKRRRRCVAITFDDGYADNLYAAKPLLEHYAIPATIFLASAHIGFTREFWWDELEQIILMPKRLPPRLDLHVDQRSFTWELQAAAQTEEGVGDGFHHRPWEALPGSRLELYYQLWLFLRPLPWQQRYHVLDILADWGDVQLSCRPSHRTLEPAEALQLADGRMIEIGAHTQTHPSLISQDLHTQQQEIERSKQDLESRFGVPMSGFSYPHGEYSEQTSELVRNADFSYACTVKAAGVSPQSDLFQLPRYEVQNWTAQELVSRLRHWF